MLEQEVNLELLNLFDLVKNAPEYHSYQQAEKMVLDDYQLLMMINEYNDLNNDNNLATHGKKRLDELKNKIDNNQSYHHYLESFNLYQTLMEKIAQIIFQDIITISKEGEGCARQQW